MASSRARERAEQARSGLAAALAWAGPGARGDAFLETAHHLTLERGHGRPLPGRVRSGRGASLRVWSGDEVRAAAADGGPAAALAACLRQLGAGSPAAPPEEWRGDATPGGEEAAGPPAAGRLLASLERSLAEGVPATGWRLALHASHRWTLVLTEAGQPRTGGGEWWRLRVEARDESGTVAAFGGGAASLAELARRWSADRLAPLLRRRLKGAAAASSGPVCEAGTPVVLAAGNGALLLHELEHALEADAAGRGWSPWIDDGPDLSELLTLWDDPSRPNLRGSYRHDDEGSPGERVLLVRRGRVTGRLGDRLRVEAGAAPRPGHGRRPSWREWPLPRAANLCLASGSDHPGVLAGEAPRVLWIHDLEAGATDPRSGDVSLVVSDGEWLEGGRPVAPVAGVTLAGNLIDLLRRVDRVCGDRAADSGAALCGREDAGVPIGLLAPTFRTAGLRQVAP